MVSKNVVKIAIKICFSLEMLAHLTYNQGIVDERDQALLRGSESRMKG
jgi:hypothetical protein